MKKFMFGLCAVAFAASVQAASITWGGAISLPDGETAVSAGTMAYLVCSDAAFTGTGVTFDGTSLKSGDSVVASMVSSHAITATEADGWDFAGEYSTAGDVNGYYAVLVSDMNATPAYSFYDLGQVTGTSATSPQTNLQVSWDTGYLTSGGYTVPGGSGTPEPTSGLLLLVGGAMLALRRKQK